MVVVNGVQAVLFLAEKQKSGSKSFNKVSENPI